MTMTFWTWLIIGTVLLVLELTTLAMFFLWLGVAALVTGLLLYFIPSIGWPVQLLIFSVLSVSSLYLSKRYFAGRKSKSEAPNLNRRAAQYIGRVFTLTEPIENGYGKVSVDDTRWQVRGPELAAGEPVKVVEVDTSVLVVEAIPPSS